MLVNLRSYHRPQNIEEAVTLLRRGSPKTRVLSGGSTLLASGRRDVEAVVDLQDLDLSYVRVQGATLYIGATTTLQQLIDVSELEHFSSGILAETAHAVSARNLRNAATIGGTVASAGGQNPLLTTLLALDASLTVYAPKSRQIPLNGFLAYRQRLLQDGALITAIGLPVLVGPLGAAFHAVGRTPRDRPIVCAAARMELAAGVISNVRLGLGGVASLPVRVTGAEQLLERKLLTVERVEMALDKLTDELAPPDDLVASAEYRRAVARVLAQRAVLDASARAQALEGAGEGDDANSVDG
jgi:carbon-monoxide dehydrogenase medium subunit